MRQYRINIMNPSSRQWRRSIVIWSMEILQRFFPRFTYLNYYQMLYFVRHAESRYNSAEKVIEKEVGEHYLETEVYLSAKFDRKYLDVEITEEGIAQAEEAKEKLKDQEFDVILVSPLRRALHTCSIIFEGHQSKAPVIIEPAFRQIMESSNDIGTEISESIAKYPHFDFRQIKDHHAWWIDTLHPADRDSIAKKLEGLEGENRKERAIEESLAIERQNWFERRKYPEREAELKERILPSYDQQTKVIQHYLLTHKRIAIVAHSECIKRYAGYKIANCQVFPFDSTQL